VTVGAYIGTPKQWRLWTKDWSSAKKPIKVYHASDAERLVGEFKGWTKQQRDDLVKRLLPVITSHRLQGIAIGINLRDFEAATLGREKLRALIGNPYAACFHWVVSEILNGYPKNQRIAFVHEKNQFQGQALEAFDAVQKSFGAERRTSLTFGSKYEFTPLQAADIIAFESNKRLRADLSKRPRRPLQALDPPGGPPLIIKYFNKENLPFMVDTLQRVQDHNEQVSAALSASLRETGL
jgi:hypothetical protein